jgi:cytochrome c oxidase subunit III
VKRTELQNNLAMMILLMSGAMLFLTLLMGFAIYRTSAEVWPPMGFNPIPLGLPGLSTATILISSWFCYQMRLAVGARDFAKASLELHMTTVLGIVFMLIQGLFWHELRASGLYVSSGVFASIMYAFTWIHAAHMVGGLLSLLWLRLVFRPDDKRLLQRAINVEKFWHFLGIIWIVLFLTLFVL